MNLEEQLKERLMMQGETFTINRNEELTNRVHSEIVRKNTNGEIAPKEVTVSTRRTGMRKKTKTTEYGYYLQTMEENKNPLNIMPENTRFKFIKRLFRLTNRVTFQWQQLFNNAAKDAIHTMSRDVNRMDGMTQELMDRVTDLTMIVTKMADKHREFSDAFDQMRDNGVGAFCPTDYEVFYKRSNSQAGEDSIMAFVFQTLGIPFNECDYLDLGANHPQFLSNTNFFYQQGARGVLVEANPDLIQALRYYRNGDILLNRCIAVKPDDSLDFYILSGDGLSTTDYDAAMDAIAKNPALSIAKTIKVEGITVNEILRTYFNRAPRIMNIDIEGMEMEILNGIDFDHYRPLLIVIEMIPYKNGLCIGEKNEEIMEFMKKKGYEEYAFTGINSIFIDRSQAEKLAKKD